MTGKLTMIGTMGIPVMTTKPENELPLRHELKHRINLREDLVLSQRLKKLFAHDKNAGPGVHTGSPACTLTHPMTAPCGRKSTGSTGGKNSGCGITGRTPLSSGWKRSTK